MNIATYWPRARLCGWASSPSSPSKCQILLLLSREQRVNIGTSKQTRRCRARTGAPTHSVSGVKIVALFSQWCVSFPPGKNKQQFRCQGRKCLAGGTCFASRLDSTKLAVPMPNTFVVVCLAYSGKCPTCL